MVVGAVEVTLGRLEGRQVVREHGPGAGDHADPIDVGRVGAGQPDSDHVCPALVLVQQDEGPGGLVDQDVRV